MHANELFPCGHKRYGPNAYRRSDGYTECRECKRIYARQRYQRLKAKEKERRRAEAIRKEREIAECNRELMKDWTLRPRPQPATTGTVAYE